MKTVDERMEFLKKCANIYELSGDSPFTDVEYDKEYAECQGLKPDDIFFSTVGGIDLKHTYGTLFTHEYVMGSLNKSPNTQDFEEWFAKTHPNTQNLIAIIDLKVDGTAFCLKYENGKLVRGVTRGDGITGLDYTPNAMFIKGVQHTIKEQGSVEIKGELYKDRNDFYKRWSKDSGGSYENPRGFTAGSINQKDPLVTKERQLSFVAYEVRGKEFETETKKIKYLEENGFETLLKYIKRIKCRGKNAKDVAKEVQEYMNNVDRELLPFSIDGVVFKLNDIQVATAMGHSDSQGKKPKANRAIKFPTEQKETTLVGIEYSMGRTGALTPVGLLKAVRLAETTVRRVSLYNLNEMSSLGIDTLGCTVLVEKAGDIIPKVIRKVKDGDKPIQIPLACPICATELKWDKTDTTLWCHNKHCPAKINGQIEHWFKRLGVKGIGEGIISKLTQEETNSWSDPLVANVSDMYDLRQHGSELKSSFGERAFQNIVEAVESVKEITLAKFIEALGIGKIGTMSKSITDIAPTIEEIDALTVGDIEKIQGFASTKAKAFINGWKDQRGEIDKLLQFISIKEMKLASNKLDGQKFCFTGSFSNPTRKEMEQLVVDNGGKKSSVSKTLTALVWDEEISGGKVNKAQKLGLNILTQDEFMNLIS